MLYFIYGLMYKCVEIDDKTISKKDRIFTLLNLEEQDLEGLKKEFENLKKTDLEKLKKFNLIEEIDNKLKILEKKIEQLKNEEYVYNPLKFSLKNCQFIFCSNDCDTLYNSALENLKIKVNAINKDIENLKNTIFYYKDGKKNKNKYKAELRILNSKVDKLISDIEKTTELKTNQYSFNSKEIKDRGNFYKNSLVKIKETILKALNEDNFYLYSKLINEGVNEKVLSIYREFLDTFKELDKDYFVVLKDKKVKYIVKLSLYTWDDTLDYPIEHSKLFNFFPNKDLYEKLLDFFKRTKGESPVCRGSIGTNGVCYISDTYFNNQVLPYILRFAPFSDTDYELYIEDIYPVYYHLYQIVSYNGKKETKLVQVDEKTFNNFKILNVVVMAKPLGYFEDQIKVEPKEIYKSVVNNPYYTNVSNPDIYPILWIIRNRLPEITLPDRDFPEDFKRNQKYKYYSSKKVLKDYAKKYGLDKKKIEEYKNQEITYSSGGGRTLGSRYRGGGYGGFGK